VIVVLDPNAVVAALVASLVLKVYEGKSS